MVFGNFFKEVRTMSSSRKSKVAVILLSALVCGSNTLANAVNKSIALKATFGVLGSAIILEAIHSWVGFKTDSVIGTGSIGRAIKNYNKLNYIKAKNKNTIINLLSGSPFGQIWLAQAANDFFDTASKNLELFNTEKFTSLTKMLKGEVSVYNCRVISIEGNPYANNINYYINIVIQKSDNQFVEYIVEAGDDSFVVFANPEMISKEKAKKCAETLSEADDNCPEFNEFSSVKLKFTGKLEFVDMKRNQKE